MSSSEDEQDDNNIYDQLKSIKAFTVDQLYSLHPDVGCPPPPPPATTITATSQPFTTTHKSADQPDSDLYHHHDQVLYQNLVEYEQLRHKLAKLRDEVKSINIKTFSHIDNVWSFTEETPRKIGMCQQGKIAETTLKYKKALIDRKQLDIFNTSFNELSELITKDFIYYSFESQMKRYKIASQLSFAYQLPDEGERKTKLKSSIITLIDFIKHLGVYKSDFVLQCRNWLRCLIKRFLEQETTENYKFIISQLSRGPAGTADWSADLIECKPFEQVTTEFESTPLYITHCSILLSELFNSLRCKIRRVQIQMDGGGGDTVGTSSSSAATTPNNEYQPDQNWSIIDPRFSCSEELNLSSGAGNALSESDVIKLCLRIPVAQIFRAYVKSCLESDDFRLETDKNYEYIMLKLLTIGTVIIRTYQIGLETFNSIQFGNLIEYLSSQIRRIVIVLSDQWAEFKRRLKGVDNALLMRLQVEYDNFILRSILIILELRQSGIWRHLSRIEQDTNQVSGGGGCDDDDHNSWSAESLRPAIVKLLQVTGLSSQTATTSSQPIELEPNQRPPTSRSSSNSLTYEFSIEWFKEVSEPMLWHILWQFYHNAFVSSCDYHSDTYWLEKFRETSVVYLFVNKMRDSSPSECDYLINSITSMLLSRSRQDSKLVNFIATELFNLVFKQESMKGKITKVGIRSLINGAEKFPNLISLYISFMHNNEVDSNIVELIKGCSLSGWICDDDEFDIISRWLIEYKIDTAHNKVARLLISKLLLNSPEFRMVAHSELPGRRMSQTTTRSAKRSPQDLHCFVDLKLRRKLALILYEASTRHLPETNDFGSQSLGTFVEVAFGTLFCEKNNASQINLIELAIDTSYQQFYVWIWRLLFTFRLHILNQPETDWNDIQSRSGTSRSIKNTVLVNDSFHPVPSLQDSECLLISEGIKNYNPVASFIYLLMTDVTWQVGNLDSCLKHLNMMAKSGHLTSSLMAMKFLTICHLSDLSDTIAKDHLFVDYFTIIITSSFDATRLASLIVTQMQNLKQYRQLQLSQFYINILLEVAAIIIRQLSSSWFSSNEYNLEKIACLLDYLVRFNFSTQRLEIIKKFYDCSYSIQNHSSANASSWFGSILSSNSSISSNSTKREFLTILHVLTKKFKKYTWLRWVTTECDTLRLEKIWEDIVVFLSTNESANLDMAIKKICPQVNPTILKSTLPIYSWIRQIFDIVESDLSHPLCPLVWYNFFLNYFANSLNGVSVGRKLVQPETLTVLLSRLDSLFNYHVYKHRNWPSNSNLQQNSLTQLYRAYRLWLQDSSLQDAYVDIDRLRGDYLVVLLKAVMESSTEGACHQYIDIQSIETQNINLSQVWSTATRLEGNHLIKEMVFVNSNQDGSMEILTSVDDEVASDAVSLIVKPYKATTTPMTGTSQKSMLDVENELRMTTTNLFEDPEVDKNRTIEEAINLIKKNFQSVFEESSIFISNMSELDKIRSEIIDLIQYLWANKRKEYTQMVPCADGIECTGPAKIKFEVEEAQVDDRKSECIQDRQRQGDALISELLIMPTGRSVQATIFIEDHISQLVRDTSRAKNVIETILKWTSEASTYVHLNGPYHPANHLLKAILEVLSSSEEEVDTYNGALLEVCFEHPGSVQFFSPHFSPSTCSTDCFLSLYKKISTKHANLGSMALFVLLSKFDVNSWLKTITSRNNKPMHYEIIRTTCSALRLMGKHPDDSFILTYELYKRHIQLELAPPERRKPEEISLVMQEFLTIMDEQLLCPGLWADFMAILGLEKYQPMNFDRNSVQRKNSTSAPTQSSISAPDPREPAEEPTMACVIEDIIRLSECQVVFDYKALDGLMKMLTKFLNAKHNSIDITLLELYQDYLHQFSVVMMSVTFMWLRAYGEQYPDNHSMIWEQFMDLWSNWIFLSKNCQNVGKTSYNLIATEYVSALRYMITKIPDNTNQILQSVLSSLANYVIKTREVVYLELTILQRCLKNLPWSSLVASPEDFEHLALLSEQENYNISDLVSHIILQVNLKESMAKIHSSDSSITAHVAERLATTIVLQSAHLKGFRLNGCYFNLISVEHISKIVSKILPRMEFANLEHSQNNKLLVNLLRFMCIKLDIDSNTTTTIGEDQLYINDSFDRSIIYARFVSSYLVDLIKNHPSVLKFHKSYLNAIMDNSLQDLKILLSPDVSISKKTTIYENLLECCSNNALDRDSRLFIAKSLIRSELLKDRPIVVMEVFNAIGNIINDGRILVYMIERMISFYLHMNGHYEKVWKSFSLKALPSDLYLEACIEEDAPLALLVYFEALSRSGQEDSQHSTDNTLTNSTGIWSSFFHWISQLPFTNQANNVGQSEVVSSDARLVVAWLRLLDILEVNLYHFIHCNRPTISNNSTDEGIDDNENSLTENTEGEGSEQAERAEPEPPKQPQQQPSLITSHKSLVNLLKHLVSIYDTYNSGGLWSYLKYSSYRTEQSSRISIIALAVACFLADRTLICLASSSSSRSSSSPDGVLSGDDETRYNNVGKLQQNSSISSKSLYLVAIRDEVSKLKKICLTKLEAARKSKHYLEHAQFIEALIESVKRNDKVQYSEGVQLITTFVRSIYSAVEPEDFTFINKILPSFN